MVHLIYYIIIKLLQIDTSNIFPYSCPSASAIKSLEYPTAMQSSIFSIFLALRNKFTSPENKKARFKNEVGTFCDPLRSGEPNKWLIPIIAPTLLCKARSFLFSWLYETSLRRLKIKKPSSKMKWALFVIRSGFEPEAFALEGRCSIQLS